MKPNPTNASWDRREGESAKAYAAFCAYRDIGAARSLTKVVQKYNGNYGSKALLAKWSSQHNWVRRCYEYDVFQEKERRKELNAYYVKMLKRHAKQARLIQEKALVALQKIDPETLTNNELIRYLEVGIKIERDTLNLPIELVPMEEERKDEHMAQRLSKELLEKTEDILRIRDQVLNI